MHAISLRDGYSFTARVGSFAPDSFGLHGLHGNVWKWVAGWQDHKYYARSPCDDPSGPASGSVGVRRGGAWHSSPFHAIASYRNWNSPQTMFVLIGFQVSRDAATSRNEKLPAQDT